MRTSILAAAVSLAALAVLTVAPSLGFAASVVTVSLWDKGAEMGMPPGLGMGMNGDMSMATMGITATPETVAAGPVTFNVTNDSKELIHEMLVVPVPADGSPLPYVADEDRVDEEAAHHLGEVSELDPGKSGSLTVDLEAGKYVLVCNIAGHYMAGMWTIIEVAP